MKKMFFRMGIALLLGGFLVACTPEVDSPEGHGHAGEGDEHGEEKGGSSYEADKGILLSEESAKAIGLELKEAGEQSFRPVVSLSAQIYRSPVETSRKYGKERNGYAYATVLVSPDVAQQLVVGQNFTFYPKGGADQPHEGMVWRIDQTQLAVLGKTEILLEFPDPDSSLTVGAFVEAQAPLGKEPRKTLAVPRSAILETSSGKHAYVKNGKFLLRTEIKTGAENEDTVEITDGLYEGDTVAVKPVETLYMIELRASKGGGHSH